MVILTSAVAGEPRKEQVDGYWIVRRGGRFTVYPWALRGCSCTGGTIRGVIDSQNGIPFFTPLVVRREDPGV